MHCSLQQSDGGLSHLKKHRGALTWWSDSVLKQQKAGANNEKEGQKVPLYDVKEFTTPGLLRVENYQGMLHRRRQASSPRGRPC